MLHEVTTMGRTKGQKIPGLERKPKREGGYFDDLCYDHRDGQVLLLGLPRQSPKSVWVIPGDTDHVLTLAELIRA